MEPWMDSIYRASTSSSPRVWVSANITPRRNEGEEEIDPHFWFDVQNSISSVYVIRDWLAIVDPANAAFYASNADAYAAELQALDAWVVERVATLPVERRKLVTSHDTFGYFAQRYGFQVVGSGFSSMSTESEPSAQQIAALIQEIRAARVPVIFAENVANPAVMERIARESGVMLAPRLYTDALGSANSPANTYVNLIRYDVDTMVTHLGR
jgi:ABC-type Zn uptake system ZnuABC Zn-binding protein ZnuA